VAGQKVADWASSVCGHDWKMSGVATTSSARFTPGKMLPVAVTAAADVNNRRRLMLNGNSCLAIHALLCETKGWRFPLGLPTVRPHPLFGKTYKTDLGRVCEELLRYDELRHFMTHGFLSLTVDRNGNHQFELLRYQRVGKGKFTTLRATTTIERLRQAAEDIGEYGSHAIRLFERIYREKKLEPTAPQA
jgi:hypothetical protein